MIAKYPMRIFGSIWTEITIGAAIYSGQRIGSVREVRNASMQWYRQPILSFADLGPVRSFTEKSSLVSGLVSRFVAGQTLEEALPKVEAIAATGITATLDELG